MYFTEDMMAGNPWWAAWQEAMRGPPLVATRRRTNPVTKMKQPPGWVGKCPKCFYRKTGFKTRKQAKDWTHVHRGFYCDKSKDYPKVK